MTRTSTAPSAATRQDLDDDTKRMLAELTANPYIDMTMSVAEMRLSFERFYQDLYANQPRTAEAVDIPLPLTGRTLSARVYRPLDAPSSPLPICMFFHGGGSIMGSVQSYDALCQELCSRSGCLIISVEYRLAPEHPYLKAVSDCYEATIWVHANARTLGGDPHRLAVCGESGGGGLAAVVALLARDLNGPPLCFQLLFYPFVGSHAESASMREFAKGYFFEAEALQGFVELNFQTRAELDDWRVSPIHAASFRDLPPAFVITAGYDILRDDAEEYVRLLNAAGTPAMYTRYPTTIHGFVAMAGAIQAGRDALADGATRLRQALNA